MIINLREDLPMPSDDGSLTQLGRQELHALVAQTESDYVTLEIERVPLDIWRYHRTVGETLQAIQDCLEGLGIEDSTCIRVIFEDHDHDED